MTPTPTEVEALARRLNARIEPAPFTSCWLWTGQRSRHYGVLKIGFKRISAHRVVYEHLRGPIPPGLTIDHLCRNSLCVRPDHLEAVTQRENTLRGSQPSSIRARADHCAKGHPFTPDNARITSCGWRRCRVCDRAAERAKWPVLSERRRARRARQRAQQ